MAAHRLRTHALLRALHDDPEQFRTRRFLATLKASIKRKTQDAKSSTTSGSGGRCGSGVVHGAASGQSNMIGTGCCIVPVGNGARMSIGHESARRCPRPPDLPAFTASPRPSTAPRRSKRLFLGSPVMMSAIGPPAGMLTPATSLPAGQRPRHDANWRSKLPIKTASGHHAFAGRCSRRRTRRFLATLKASIKRKTQDAKSSTTSGSGGRCGPDRSKAQARRGASVGNTRFHGWGQAEQLLPAAV